MKHRTLRYWPTRIMLAVGVIATAAVVLGAKAADRAVLRLRPLPDVLGLPSTVWLAISSIALAVVGLVWMVRIFRGPRDEPPDWRYRDR